MLMIAFGTMPAKMYSRICTNESALLSRVCDHSWHR